MQNCIRKCNAFFFFLIHPSCGKQSVLRKTFSILPFIYFDFKKVPKCKRHLNWELFSIWGDTIRQMKQKCVWFWSSLTNFASCQLLGHYQKLTAPRSQKFLFLSSWIFHVDRSWQLREDLFHKSFSIYKNFHTLFHRKFLIGVSYMMSCANTIPDNRKTKFLN